MFQSFKLIIATTIIGAVTILTSSETSAATCIARIAGGCIFFSGSVEGNLNANQVHTSNNPELGMNITPLDMDSASEPDALILCANPNDHLSSGIQVVKLFTPVVDAFSQSVPLTKDNRVGHTFFATVRATPLDPSQPDFAQDFDALQAFCPNPHWTPSDYVTCNSTTQVRQKENGVVKEDQTTTYLCSLPDCATLGYSSTTQQFDRRQYDCTKQQE